MVGPAESAPLGAGSSMSSMKPRGSTDRRHLDGPHVRRKPFRSPGYLGTAAKAARDDLRDSMRDLLLDEFGPSAIVVDEMGAILRQFGDLTGILRLPKGDSDYEIGSLIDPQLRTEVTSVITQSLRGSRRQSLSSGGSR